MFLKKIDKVARKRIITNAVLLLLGTLILMAFLLLMQAQSARNKQKSNSHEVLTEIDAALSQNDSQIKAIEKQYHDVNLSKLKSLRRMFGYGLYRDILNLSKTEQRELMDSAAEAVGTTLLFLLDEDGNIMIKSDRYEPYFKGAGDKWNITTVGLLSEKEWEKAKSGTEDYYVTNDNWTFFCYCLPINMNEEGSVDRLYLLTCEDSGILDLELSSIGDIGKVLGDVTVGTSGFAFATDSETKEFKFFSDGEIDLTGTNAEDFGLKEEALKDGYEGTQVINGERYFCVSKKCEYDFFGKDLIITTVEKEDEVWEERSKVVFFAIIAFLAVAIFIIIYAFILQSDAAVRGKSLKLKKLFSFRGKNYCINLRLQKALLPATAVGIFLFFCVSMYSQTLLSLSRAVSQSEAAQEEIEQKLITNNNVKEIMTNYYESQYLSKTLMAAHLLEETPNLVFSKKPDELDVHAIMTSVDGNKKEVKDEYGNVIYSNANSSMLDEICTDNNFTSIYVFDENGRVRATNNSDWFFTISENEEDQSYEFRDIIDGKKSSFIQDVMISDSGESMQFIGCAFNYYTAQNAEGNTVYMPAYQYVRQGKGEYEGPLIKAHRGMVQIGISAQTVQNILEVTSFKYLLSQMYIMDNGFIIAFDNDENHTVLYSPDELMIDKTAAEIGFFENDFANSYNGFKKIGNQKCFVSVREAAEHFIATLIPTESLYRVRNNIALASLIAGLIVIIGILMMTIVMSESEWDAYSRMVEDINSKVYVTKAEGQSSDASIRHRTPEQKLARLVKVYLYLAVIVVWTYDIIVGSGGRGTMMNYILGFKWNRVPNIISLTACGIILFSGIVAADFLSAVVTNISKSLGARAGTISHLLMACLKFFAIVAIIFVCLYFIGFDIKSLVTSAGLLSVVFGFGAQNLISDILSGIFIVMEGSFRVGDFVTIGDFRGEVREIGLRTTKIESDDFNVKIFNNSSISEIINLTKENSFASIIVEIPYDADVELVEKIVKDSFKSLRAKYDNIVADPIYRGITNFGSSGIEINIWVPCFEIDRPQMERDVRKDIIKLFNDHNISVPFTHIVNVPYEKSDIKE